MPLFDCRIHHVDPLGLNRLATQRDRGIGDVRDLPAGPVNNNQWNLSISNIQKPPSFDYSCNGIKPRNYR